jgi:hypothetical protein
VTFGLESMNEKKETLTLYLINSNERYIKFMRSMPVGTHYAA